MEPIVDASPAQKTLHFRHYLNVEIERHRIALTRLLLSNHCLAVERLRWTEHRRPRIERHLRLCRFCREHIETPEHALFDCDGKASLVTLREEFLGKLYKDNSPFLPDRGSMQSAEYLRRVLSIRSTVNLLAKFAYDVVEIYKGTKMRVPSLPLYWLIRPQTP